MTRLNRRWVLTITGAACVTAFLAAAITIVQRSRREEPPPRAAPQAPVEPARQALFEAIQPVRLVNCEFERYGESHDGGYLLCGNLLTAVRSAYSYGIAGYDQWGCDVSTRLSVSVHQYDCFDLTRPLCSTGKTVFHAECIGGSRRVEDGRTFDTLARQISKNGDAGKRIVVKMDVETAEWESLLGAPDEVLRRIDQLVVEFHGVDEAPVLEVISKLKRFFHVANLHWNNNNCHPGGSPFPSAAYEMLFVSKRIGVPDPARPVTLPNPLDEPNNLALPDCQVKSP
jgi:hypothetical protein